MDFGLNVKAAGHAIRVAGAVAGGRARRDDVAETDAGAGVRGTGPVYRSHATYGFNPVTRSIVCVFRALAGCGIRIAKSQFRYRMKTQPIRRSNKARGLVAGRSQYINIFDCTIRCKLGREGVQNGGHSGRSHGRAVPTSGVGVAAVHGIGGVKAVFERKRHSRLIACAGDGVVFEVAYYNRNELAGGKLQILGIANGEEQATLFAAVAYGDYLSPCQG